MRNHKRTDKEGKQRRTRNERTKEEAKMIENEDTDEAVDSAAGETREHKVTHNDSKTKDKKPQKNKLGRETMGHKN